jgi:hypothetical protein
MGQPREDLYFLTDEDGRCYYVNNGMVEKSSIPVPLPVGPDGWQQKSIKYARNPKYYGLFRSFSTPLKFVGDGAQIIRDRLYKNGTEDKMYLLIHRLDKTFGGGWIHKLFYKGELDLTQADDEETFISTNIMEGDLVKFLTANAGTTYTIPLNVPEAVMVKDDGVFLYETINYLITDQPTLGSEDTTPGRGRLPYISFINQEGSAFGIGSASVFSTNDTGTTPTNFTTSSDWLFIANQDVPNMNISGSLAFQMGNSNFEAYLYTSLGRKISLFTQATVRATEYSIPFNIDFAVTNGEKVFFVITGNPPDIGYPFLFIKESRFKISFKSRYKTTYTRCLRPAYVFQFLLDKMTGGGYTFHSDYLTNVWENLVITSGDGIRGIVDAAVKTSFDDCFSSFNIPCNLCAYVKDQTLYIEPKSNAYGSTVVADLGEITKFVIKPSADAQYNVVKIGYPNLNTHDFDSLNAKGEFNITNTFTSPISRINKVLDLTSKYKASMYEQELNRINLDGKTTTSDSSDNDVFFKHIEKTIQAPPATVAWYFIKYNGGTSTHYFVNTYTGFYDTRSIPQPLPYPASVNLSDLVFVALGFLDMLSYIGSNPSYPGWDGQIYSTTTTSTIGAGAVPYYNLLRETYSSVTGLLDPATAFNIGISPKRCMLAHGNLLRSIFYWQEAGALVFQSSDINAALVTVKDGITISESADQNIGSLDAPLFIPLDLIVDSPMMDGIIDVMASDPAETFQFNYNGQTFTGFTKTVGIQPATKAAQTTTLQCSPTNDLTTLIQR